MCKWGTDKLIHVIRRNNPDVPDGWHPVYVDACIADYVHRMNDQGIITTACCCGHGKGPGAVLVVVESVPLLNELGYEHHPYDNRDDVVEHTLPPCDAVRMAMRGDDSPQPIERIRKLESIVSELAEHGYPIYQGPSTRWECAVCGGRSDYNQTHQDVRHWDNCAWVAACKMFPEIADSGKTIERESA